MNDNNICQSTLSGNGHKTLTTYLVGFNASLFLTIIAFYLVFRHLLSDTHLYIAVVLLALAQLYVQVIFFLRVNASKESRMNLLSFLFTILIITVLVGGSLWIMYNLNYNMMH